MHCNMRSPDVAPVILHFNEAHSKSEVDQRYQFLTYSASALLPVIYHLWQYSQGITPSERVKVRHSPVARENLTNNQP